MVKNLPAMQETWVPSLDWEDPLEKKMITHSSILDWEIPRTEEPGELQSMGLQRVRHNLETQQQQKGLYYVPETDLDAGKYSRNKIESILELMAFTSNKHKQTAVTDMKKNPQHGHETEGGWNGC